MEIGVYNKDKKQIKTIVLDETVFNVKVKPGVIHEVVRILRANLRHPIAHAKDRGAVSGGGKKPWRQKGTGRARHGSIRSPLWRKGGVTHGPLKQRVFARSLNKKTKRAALTMIISGKAQKGVVCVVADEAVADFSKTKSAQAFANVFLKHGQRFHRAVLVHDFPKTELTRGLRNLPFVSWLPVSGMNIMALVNSTYLIIPESSVTKVVSFIKRT